MSVLVPRLDREAARLMLERARITPVEVVANELPYRDAVVTLSAVGGAQVSNDELNSLRQQILELANAHGYPRDVRDVQTLETSVARTLYSRLPMTPHEASSEGVWTYLTCCWLLDVALWRFGSDADERRFIGNVNRNTFRRLWWRVETFGSLPIERLGEDELVNIVERPTVTGDRRLAQAIVHEFLRRISEEVVTQRMMLMREAMKRLLRLMPFVSFEALNDDELRRVVVDAFDSAAAGLAGRALQPQAAAPLRSPVPSPLVQEVDVTVSTTVNGSRPDTAGATSGDEHALAGQLAVDIARKTGKVTNMQLREVLPVNAEEAREILQTLVAAGELQRRGVKRGTHYVVPAAKDSEPDRDIDGQPGRSTGSPVESSKRDTALRRLLRRDRGRE